MSYELNPEETVALLESQKRQPAPSLGNAEVHTRKIGRNDLCPCGSGKKFKHCCIGSRPSRMVMVGAPRTERVR